MSGFQTYWEESGGVWRNETVAVVLAGVRRGGKGLDGCGDFGTSAEGVEKWECYRGFGKNAAVWEERVGVGTGKGEHGEGLGRERGGKWKQVCMTTEAKINTSTKQISQVRASPLSPNWVRRVRVGSQNG